MAEVFANLAESTLSGAITDAQTAIGVADGSVFPAGGDYRVVCDREIMLCTGRSGNTLTVQRGIESTTAVGHVSGSVIAHVLTAASLLLIPVAHTALSSVTADQHHAQAHAIGGADHTGALSHGTLTSVTADQHHAESHTLASHSTRPHSDLTGVGIDDHHAKSHAHSGDGSGTVAHSDIGSVTADQHHAESHTLTSHSTRAHSELTGVGNDDHHAKAHTVAEHTTAVTVEDEGVSQGNVKILNFVGSGVSVTVVGDEATIDATAASGTGYAEVQDEGSAVTVRGKLNFTGSTVTATDDAGNVRTNVTLPDYAGTGDIADVNASEEAGAASTVARGDHGHRFGILTTKGDILAYSSDPIRLGVGGNGTFLIGDSTAAAGVAWFDHTGDTTNAHLAQGVSIADSAGDFTATDVEGALAELQSDNEAHAASTFPHSVTRVVKSADEVVNNSAVLQSDDELTFSVGANEDWEFEFIIGFRATTTADLTWDLSVPASGLAFGMKHSIPAGGASKNDGFNVDFIEDMTVNQDQGGIGTTSSDNVLLHIKGYYDGAGTAGSVTFRWAQRVAEATNTRVLARSYLIARRVF